MVSRFRLDLRKRQEGESRRKGGMISIYDSLQHSKVFVQTLGPFLRTRIFRLAAVKTVVQAGINNE